MYIVWSSEIWRISFRSFVVNAQVVEIRKTRLLIFCQQLSFFWPIRRKINIFLSRRSLIFACKRLCSIHYTSIQKFFVETLAVRWTQIDNGVVNQARQSLKLNLIHWRKKRILPTDFANDFLSFFEKHVLKNNIVISRLINVFIAKRSCLSLRNFVFEVWLSR